MRLKYLTIVLLITAIFGCKESSTKFSLPSSWIGTIKMGDATPELVFYIYEDSLEETVGHLGIPSKGIEKVPFDRVLISQDSINFNISAALASFKGVLNESQKTIDGIWKEGENEFPITLSPLDKTIDYTKSRKVNTSSLDLGLTDEFFNYYSEKKDSTVLEELSKTLNSEYLRIVKNMNTAFDSKIDVLIYPDTKAFHKAINYPDAPDWVVGAASKNELKMVSPLNPGNVHSYESLMQAIVHELVHTVVLNFRNNGLVGLPNWLNEGYAYYEAGQLAEEELKLVQSKVLKKDIPTWQELEEANTSQFGELGGYGMSASIVKFLIETYGYQKFKQYLIAPKNTKGIYEMTQKDLELKWLDYIRSI